MKRSSEPNYYVKKKRANMFIFIAYLVLGIYFINFSFQFVQIPEYISKFDKWVVFAGGILMLFGAINYFRVKRN
jgi:predicted membrane channel-forming protein YqfA (hemolysin III family)